MQPGRSLQLSSYSSHEVLGVSTKRAATNRERGKRGNAVHADVGYYSAEHLHSLRLIGILQYDTIQFATQRRESRDDCGSSSSSTVKQSLSPSMEIASPPLHIAQLKHRSQSMREWRKGRLDAQYEPSPTSTLVGTPVLIPKSRQLSRG